MKNTKNTRVQKQQKKAKKQRRISSTLMCGLVLSSVALPAVAVLADNAVQNQAPQTSQSTTQSSKATKVEIPTTASEAVKTVQDTPATQDKSAQGTITVNAINEKDGSVIKSHTFTGAVGSKLTWGQIFETIDTSGWSSTGHQDIDGADGQMGYLLFKDTPRTVNPTFISNNPDDQKTKISMKLNFVELKTGKVLKAPYTSTIIGYPNSGTDLAGLVESGMPDPNIEGYDLVNEDGDIITINNSGVYEYGSGGNDIPEHNVYYKKHKEDPVENVTFKTRYVDDATGKDIAPAETDTLPVGSSYSASAIDIPHYKLNSAKDVNFTVQKGQKDVIFHYTKDQESFVEFKLVDAKTNKEIGTTVKRSGQEGQWTSIDPNSKEFKIDGYTMRKEFYQTPGLGTKTYDFPEPGKTNSVTVKYDKDGDKPDVKKGTLTVRYTDIRGNEIKASTTQEGKVGDIYEVVAPDIKGWKLNDNSPNLYRDKYKEGNTTVTFKYDKTPDPVKQGSVTVQYVDQDGKAIKEAKTLKGDVGSKYSEDAPTIKGYTLTSDKTLKGEFTEKAQTVKFTYKKDKPTPDPVKQGSVTFKYVDKDSKQLKEPKTIKGDVGKAFEEKAPSIKGYSLDKSKSDETYKGKFTKQGQTYYFVYNKDVKPTPDSKLRPVLEQAIKDAKPYSDKAKYQAKYVDALDKAISDAKAFLKANPAPKARAKSSDLDSKFQAQIDNVTTAVNNVKANPIKPTPTKTSKITVKLVDADTGKEIKAPKTIEGKVNSQFFVMSDKYFSEPVKGYQLTDSVVNAVLTFTEHDSSYTLAYKKADTPTPDPVKQGSVTFKYVDKDSKELKAPKTIKGDVGKAFEEKAPSIKGYKLDTTKSDETYKGKFTKQGQTYYFVYVGDGSTPSNNNNNNNSGNNNPSDNKDVVLIDSNGTPLTSDQSKNTLKVDNTKNKNGLPETGESSPFLMTLSGLGVLMASVLAFIVKRKPKRD